MARARAFFSLLFFLLLLTPFSSAREPDIIPQLREDFPGAIISFDPATNTIVVTATPEEQEKIWEMLKTLDAPPPQIAIEARFIEFIVTDTGELGGELRLRDLEVGAIAADATVDIIVNWVFGFPADPAAGIIRLLQEPGVVVDPKAIIRALAKEGRVEVISAPRVVTLSGHTAEIKLEEKVPYLTEVGHIEVSPGVWEIEFPPPAEKDAGIFLEVTPTAIEGETLITMEIVPTVKFLVKRVRVPEVPAHFGYPIIDERITQTHAVIESGETIILGGLIGREERIMDRGLPLLGNIPVLGRLFFRHRYHLDEKRKLLIFLTAHLVDPWGEVAVARREN